MSVLNKMRVKVGSALGLVPSSQVQLSMRQGMQQGYMQAARQYAAAKNGRLTNDMGAPLVSIDAELLSSLSTVRGRVRRMVMDNDYAKKYMRLLRQNVVGPQGFTLQSQAAERDGTPDRMANIMIEEAWNDWCRAQNCSVTGRLSMRAMQHILIQHAGRDGEALVRFVVDKKSKYGLRIQLLQPDVLDDMYNVKTSAGNVVKMGVEVDKWWRPINYHLKKFNPENDLYFSSSSLATREVVSASEIIHGFDQEYAAQTRGISWMVQSMLRTKDLNEYEKAAVINARISAAKMGFFKQSADAGSGVTGDDQDDEGNAIIDAEAGSFQELPPGLEFQGWDPKFPSEQHGVFVKSQLRGVSSGLGVAYNSLASDLEGVNYSSIRAGLLDERDNWMLLQEWFIETFLEPIFERWLESAIASGRLNLPMAKFEKFNSPKFIAKRWPWVDPKNDIDAKLTEVEAGGNSLRNVISEAGRDRDEVFQQLAEDKAAAEKLGLKLSVFTEKARPIAAPVPPADPANGKMILFKNNGHKELVHE